MLRMALAFVLSVLACSGAQAAPRFALVIGNASYASPLTPLRNPPADAQRIGDALARAQFTVTPLRDADRAQTLRAVRALADQLRAAGPDAVGFFYYSGHGGSALEGGQRRNYLIPARAAISGAQDLVSDGVALDTIVSILSTTGARAVFIVFDACRTELPFSKGGDDPDKAFGVLPSRPGLLIAFATDAGASAPDDGAFSTALAEELVRPGVDHTHAFKRAATLVGLRRDVNRLPWISDQIPQDIVFVGGPREPEPPFPARMSAPRGPAQPPAQATAPAPVPATAPRPTQGASGGASDLPDAIDLTNRAYTLSALLDVNGTNEASVRFSLAGQCQLTIQAPRDVGFKVRYGLFTDRGSMIERSLQGSQAPVKRVDLPGGVYVFALGAIRDAGQYAATIAARCS